MERERGREGETGRRWDGRRRQDEEGVEREREIREGGREGRWMGGWMDGWMKWVSEKVKD